MYEKKEKNKEKKNEERRGTEEKKNTKQKKIKTSKMNIMQTEWNEASLVHEKAQQGALQVK